MVQETFTGEEIEVPPTTRELSRYVRYYEEHIRPMAARDKVGVMRLIQGLLRKDITCEMIEIALRNYANDPYRREGDPRLSMHIRSFFTPTNITLWQNPIKKRTPNRQAPVPDKLSRFEEALRG